MLHHSKEAWFAAKRYGYGAGWPIAPQGWVLLAAYLLLATGCALLAEHNPARALAVMGGVFLPATIAFCMIAARRTRGGWRWRWGDPD